MINRLGRTCSPSWVFLPFSSKNSHLPHFVVFYILAKPNACIAHSSAILNKRQLVSLVSWDTGVLRQRVSGSWKFVGLLELEKSAKSWESVMVFTAFLADVPEALGGIVDVLQMQIYNLRACLYLRWLCIGDTGYYFYLHNIMYCPQLLNHVLIIDCSCSSLKNFFSQINSQAACFKPLPVGLKLFLFFSGLIATSSSSSPEPN